ncbi:PREDICTED: spindle pole body component 110 [Ceratosolen solmsi marchali]|uniref:Cilia- and flagella-associated protein 157 n=1 Tax=Ceratosolen solmsi marchali TaxID=326594 RepID=A0AAJ7DYE3_9HYME|nr:PREDICTED: spindle pole body component 110 [Ceratosolen solmsi marchali]
MKKKGKKDKQRKKNFLSELEIEIYEQQIVDSNRQLARLRTHNEELERKVESIEKKLKELEENKADLTSHLQQVLQKKTEEAQELHERLISLDKIHNEEQQHFKKKEELLENEFQTMEHNLIAEVKLAAGKLSALEEWRLNRIDLMTKFEEQEKNVKEQEIRHKNILYEAEKRFIIGKARMQNELDNRLTELSKSFRSATALRLANTSQRAIYENISLHQELNRLLGQCRILDIAVQNYKERERIWRLHSLLYEAESCFALEKVARQNRNIEYLAIEHERMSRVIGRICRSEKYILHGDKILEKAKQSCNEAQNKIRFLEQSIELSQDSREGSMKKVFDNCQEIQKLSSILFNVKETIEQILLEQTKLTCTDNDSCSTHFINIKEKFLHLLLDMMKSYQEQAVEDIEEIEVRQIYNNCNVS